MPIGILNLEWLNHNSQRNYPLAASASGLDITNTFKLPEDFILALSVSIHAGIDTDSSRYFIKHIGAFGANGYSITLGYQPAEGAAINVATAQIARGTHQRYNTYALGGINDFVDTRAHVVIGELDRIDLQPAGFFEFEFEATRLEPDVIRPMIRGIAGIRIRNSNDVSRLLTGIVELQAGTNVQLQTILEVGENPIIQVNAVEGAGLTEECVCEGDTEGVCIRRINGIPPTSAGDFTIIGDDCIEVGAATNGITLRDTCSAPCCGCPELEEVTRALSTLQSKGRTLEGFIIEMQQSVRGFDTIVLGSKLGDRGCLTC